MAERGPAIDAALLLVAPDDDVCIARRPLSRHETLRIDGVPVRIADDVGILHKLSRRAIAKGAVVCKHGHPIGIARCDIRPGDWVHVHNLESAYIPSLAVRSDASMDSTNRNGEDDDRN